MEIFPLFSSKYVLKRKILHDEESFKIARNCTILTNRSRSAIVQFIAADYVQSFMDHDNPVNT